MVNAKKGNTQINLTGLDSKRILKNKAGVPKFSGEDNDFARNVCTG